MRHAPNLSARSAALLLAPLSVGWVACGGNAMPVYASDDGGSSGGDAQVSPPGHDASVPTVDASSPAPDAAQPPYDAGPPAPRNASCTPLTAQTGKAVNTPLGRLDGNLVYILGLNGSHSCNGDGSHIHLQVEVAGLVYDVAVDIGTTQDEVGWYETTIAPPQGAFAEGWHGSDLIGYPSLGAHSPAFTMDTPTAVAAKLESLLASTSKISVYCTGYSPSDNGCHDVHYLNGSNGDGALVLDPTAAVSPVIMLKFSKDTF